MDEYKIIEDEKGAVLVMTPTDKTYHNVNMKVSLNGMPEADFMTHLLLWVVRNARDSKVSRREIIKVVKKVYKED